MIEMLRPNKCVEGEHLGSGEMAHWVSTVLRTQHLHKKLGRAAHRPVTPVLCWVETERLSGFMGRLELPSLVHVQLYM